MLSIQFIKKEGIYKNYFIQHFGTMNERKCEIDFFFMKDKYNEIFMR